MKREMLIGLGVAAALAASAYGLTASAQSGPGYYGPGMMDGYGPGYDRGRGSASTPDYGPGYGHMRGYGAGNDQEQGYGPGYHMRGWGRGYGPGMMQGFGYGRGYGHGMMGW